MTNIQEIFLLINGISVYDWKKLIKYFQSKKLYDNSNSPSKQNVLTYLSNEDLYSSLSDNQLNIIKYELTNIHNNLVKYHKGKRNYHKLILEKQIFDYNLEIEKLKQTSFNYKKKINLIDSDTDIIQFEKFTIQWAEIQEKIIFLSNEVRKFKKQLG